MLRKSYDVNTVLAVPRAFRTKESPHPPTPSPMTDNEQHRLTLTTYTYSRRTHTQAHKPGRTEHTQRNTERAKQNRKVEGEKLLLGRPMKTTERSDVLLIGILDATRASSDDERRPLTLSPSHRSAVILPPRSSSWPRKKKLFPSLLHPAGKYTF